VQRLKETRTHLAPANASEIPVSDFRKDLEAQQARMLSDQERLNELLREIPEGDEYSWFAARWRRNGAALINLQNTVALRIHALEHPRTNPRTPSAGASGGETEAQKLDEILKVWDEERAVRNPASASTAARASTRPWNRRLTDRGRTPKKGAAGSKGNQQKPARARGSNRQPPPPPPRRPAGNAMDLGGHLGVIAASREPGPDMASRRW